MCVLFLINITEMKNAFPQRDLEKRNWIKIYHLVIENKLPLLSEKEEEKILNEVDRILKEEKSIHSACLYLVENVGSYEGGYLIYGNQRIKEKLVELLKLRIQCGLKASKECIDERGIKEMLDSLIKKDGDLCSEYYVDKAIEEEKERLAGGEDDEGLPGGLSWDVSVFYSVAMSSFYGNIYDYIQVAETMDLYLHLCLPHINILYFPLWGINDIFIVTLYPEKFLEDIEKGYYIRKSIWGINEDGYEKLMKVESIIKKIKKMPEFNPDFFKENKMRIKKMISKIITADMKYYSDRVKNILSEKTKEELENDMTIWDELSDHFIYDIRQRVNVLELYEQIGEKIDIEDIKKLGENIPLDYPIRSAKREYDEKIKERYHQQVKELQERVNALIERLSKE